MTARPEKEIIDIDVREYKSAKDFEKDAKKRLRDGWTIQGQSQDGGHINMGRTLTGAALTGGLSLLFGGSRSKGMIVVTWVLGQEDENDGAA